MTKLQANRLTTRIVLGVEDFFKFAKIWTGNLKKLQDTIYEYLKIPPDRVEEATYIINPISCTWKDEAYNQSTVWKNIKNYR